ncbi:formin-2-like [Macadamia integrifolia]|uniref:formin-2-like n=1 Tax=Macadamia integrifolia TaxID=60698 RepID=UPI001C52A71F|nr:formin-2-like [Macadamia integrifolia]
MGQHPRGVPFPQDPPIVPGVGVQLEGVSPQEPPIETQGSALPAIPSQDQPEGTPPGVTPRFPPHGTPPYRVPPPYQYYLAYPPYYPLAATTTRLVESFKWHLPPIFTKVGSDPLESDRWIQEMKKIFEVVEYTEPQNLICAGLQLRNEADS